VRRVKSAIVPIDRSRPRPTVSRAPEVETAAAKEVDLSVDLGRGLVLRNPLIGASGAFGFGVEVADAVDLEAFGAIVTRSVTLRARTGNAPPRMVDVPAGVLTGVGLQNPGVNVVIERYAGAWAGWRTPVIVSIAGESVADVVAIVNRLEGEPGVAGLEINLGCSNAARGGLAFGLDPEAAGGLVAAVRRATDLPLIAKLSPHAADVRAVARAVAAAGADAVSAINTLPGLALAADRSRPALGSIYGGMSGPAIRPLALRVVFEIAQSVDVPIVGLGGVGSIDDVLDFLAVGASAVGVATAALAEPGLPGRLAVELAQRCRELGLDSHRSLVRPAVPRRPVPPSTNGAEYRS
jgi:dihydroorotate dehydrogenase (NAD+) catalytic subunit